MGRLALGSRRRSGHVLPPATLRKNDEGREEAGMYLSHFAGAVVLVAALVGPQSEVRAFDDARYPDLNGQWLRADVPGEAGLPPFDPSKPPGRGQQAPLTAEYQAKFEAIFAERAASGLSDVVSTTCLAPGMPMMMQAYAPMQITVLPETTYILIDHIHEAHRRIFTDGRVLAEGGRADLHRLFHRKMDRHQRRRPLRRAGSRNPLFQGTALFRQQRHPAA